MPPSPQIFSCTLLHRSFSRVPPEPALDEKAPVEPPPLPATPPTDWAKMPNEPLAWVQMSP
jgi:hypothetical protein